jgi:type IV pilus assembly protein PilB
MDIEAYEPVGCSRCGGSGYKGRIGLYEVMRMSDEIRALILQRAPVHEIERVAVAQGMTTLSDDGYAKVRSGETTIAEVIRVTS